MDDAAVVAVAAGAQTDGLRADATGFDAFVASHASRLLRTAYLLTGDHGAAEDLLQDTLVRAWSRWSRVVGTDQPLAYVRRMLVNASVSRWRGLRARPAERLVPDPPDRAEPVRAGPDDEVWALVGTLPPRQRAVVVLSYYEDLLDAQVAEALGCTTGTVKSQRAKALRSLRRRLGEEDRT
ncbi:MAG TPA: SigE family RNA polymerase sigma factor [Actinomycetes bacterium]